MRALLELELVLLPSHVACRSQGGHCWGRAAASSSNLSCNILGEPLLRSKACLYIDVRDASTTLTLKHAPIVVATDMSSVICACR
jgi:hypothetical protein